MITTNREQLIAALDRCAKLAPQRPTIPIVANARIEVSAGRLRYRATDLSSELSGDIDADGSGSFVVNPRSLSSAVSALSGSSVALKPGSGFVQATGETTRSFKIETLSIDEFPERIPVDGTPRAIAAELLAELVATTSFAARQENDKPAQNRVHIEPYDDGLLAVATNGHRAALRRVKTDARLSLELPLELARILKDLKDGEVSVSVGERAMSFEIGRERLSALFPSGEFGAIARQADGVSSGAFCLVSSESLLDSVRAVLRVDSEKDIRLEFSPGKLRIECSGRGSAFDEIDADCTVAHECWLDGAYLTDALAVVSGDVNLGYGPDELDPLMIEQQGWKYLVMPRRGQQVKARKSK